MRDTSLKLKYTSENTSKLANTILENQNLLRYIHYLDNKIHPLDKNNKDVNWFVVRNNNFVFTHFNEEILTETKIILFFNPVISDFRNPTISKDVYSLSVVIPNMYWIIGNNSQFELRGWKIMREIVKILDQKNIVGVGDVKVTNIKAGVYNNNYSIISCTIETENPSIKGFGD